MFFGSEQKNGIASWARRLGSAVFSLMMSLLPVVVMPEMLFALPSTFSWAPTMLPRNGAAGDCMFGSARRSMLNLNEPGVTNSLEGGENLKAFLRIVNV